MRELDHWHPVLLSDDVRRAPVAVTLCGVELVVFRARSGRVAAFEDRCPHRGMRLSCGQVRGERLECPYHGWRFDTNGRGESPGTPRLRAQARTFEALERHDLIWVRAAHSESLFPKHAVAPGHHRLCTLRHRCRAPLELVLDNFTEVEHTPTTHAFFGYPRERMAEVETRVEADETSVRVVNSGPQRPLPRLLEPILSVRTGDRFVDDWTTYFSPVYTHYHQWWADPDTGARRGEELRVSVFLSPIDDEATQIFTLAHANLSPLDRRGLGLVLQPLFRHLVEREVRRDIQMLEQLADRSTGLRGKKLSRFDRPLGENRRRIARLYRGRSETAK